MSFELLTRLHEIAYITESVGSCEHEGTNEKGEKVKFTISFTKRAKKEHGGVTEQYTIDKVSPQAKKIDGKEPAEWALSKLSTTKKVNEAFAARQGESTFVYKDGEGKSHQISCTWEFDGGSYAILNVEVNGKPSTNPKIERWCERQCVNGNVVAGAKPSRAHRLAARQNDFQDDHDYADDDNDYRGPSMGGNSDDYWRRGLGEAMQCDVQNAARLQKTMVEQSRI